LPSELLSRHGVKEKHQPLYQKLVLTMAQKEGFGSPRSPLVGPTGSKAALRPYSPPVGSNPFSSYFPCITKETLISQSLFLGAEGGIWFSSLAARRSDRL